MPETMDEIWELLQLRQKIKRGLFVPIISDSVRTERIFDIDYDYDVGLAKGEVDSHIAELNIEEELAEKWAKKIGYPLPDKHRLARVAVYNSVKSRNDPLARCKYLTFLKEHLVQLAKGDDKASAQLRELNKLLKQNDDIEDLSFSRIATILGYPRFGKKCLDPLRLLAKLHLPIYVTTSYFDFMERALRAEGRPPRTQICFILGKQPGQPPADIAEEHKPDPDYVPNQEEPLVYHLHGFEDYPESLVLSEDDYLDFLVRTSEERRTSHAPKSHDPTPPPPIIPVYLPAHLVQSSLILLGYRLQDWDFRVLFRGFLRHMKLRTRSLAIQLDPHEQKEIEDSDAAREYLDQYFEPEKFFVVWGTIYSVVKALWDKWNRGG